MPRIPPALLRTTIRADRKTFDAIDAHAARADFRTRGAYLLHAGLRPGAAQDDASVRALAALAQALHTLHADALSGRPTLPPALLDDLARRTRRALAHLSGRR